MWLFLYSLGAWFSTGFHHFDEHFQIIEFAQYKLGHNTADELTWEFHERMRPALQPLLAYCGLQLMAGLDPFQQMFVFRWLTAILSLLCAYFFFQKCKDDLPEQQQRWFYWLNFGLWVLVYSRLRFSSEAWSAMAMLLGFCLVYRENRIKQLFIAGFVLGLSFIFRFQAGAFVAGIGLWMLLVGKYSWRLLLTTFLGIVVAIGTGVLADRWFYGEWVFTPWHYLDLNILQDRVSGFGTSPWYQYFLDFIAFVVPPISLGMLALLLAGIYFFPRHLINWAIWPFILLHIVVGHKEARFLFPVLAFVPYVVVAATVPLQKRFAPLFGSKVIKTFAWLNGLALLIVLFKPAEANMKLYRWMYDNYSQKQLLMVGLNDLPYEHENLQVKFFRATGWTRMRFQADSLPVLNDFSDKLVVVNQAIAYDTVVFKQLTGENPELLYRDMPAWLAAFEFKDWYRRSNKWHVYRLKQLP